ncbi:MAG: hypothetical protein IJ324_05325 [Lachnospiraceae bacterium]|nr:hypothetical protein [Lachnospiraceae bacterium]
MSTSVDVTGTVEAVEKEKTPKEETAWKSSLGHAVKSCMTVIRMRMGRYHKCKGIILSESLWSAHIVSTFFNVKNQRAQEYLIQILDNSSAMTCLRVKIMLA